MGCREGKLHKASGESENSPQYISGSLGKRSPLGQTPNLARERTLKNTMAKEEADLKQRSKVSWLRLGDTISRFFNIATRTMRLSTLLSKSSVERGNETVTRVQLESNSLGYFKSLFCNIPNSQLGMKLALATQILNELGQIS